MECKCGSGNVVKNGVKRIQRGVVQIYNCKDCRKSFREKTPFFRKRYSKEVIIASIDLYFKGLSLRKIQNHLEQFYNVRPSDVTILKWVRQYSINIHNNVMKKIKISSDVWHLDETFIDGIKGHKRPVWNIIDGKSRYILVSHPTMSHDMNDAQKVIDMAKSKVERHPLRAVSDGLESYRTIFKNQFPNTEHRRMIGIQKHYNNKIESFHRTMKDRIRVIHGFNSFLGARVFLYGWSAHQNFIMPHKSINKTPAQALGINNLNTWEKLIEKADTNNNTL